VLEIAGEGEERSAERSNRSGESIAVTNARSESAGPLPSCPPAYPLTNKICDLADAKIAIV